jgi:hypothetical protein
MRKKKSVRREAGQSLVEFSAFLTVMMILIALVLDLGRAFFYLVAIENAAGEGVLFASYHPTWITEGDVPTDVQDVNPAIDNITYRAINESSPGGLVDLQNSPVDVMVSYGEGVVVGAPITVTVWYSHSLMTPFGNLVVGSDILPLQASANQIIVHLDD